MSIFECVLVWCNDLGRRTGGLSSVFDKSGLSTMNDFVRLGVNPTLVRTVDEKRCLQSTTSRALLDMKVHIATVGNVGR